MKITINFQSSDLFAGWEYKDAVQYDEPASAARYADMVEREVRDLYPEATVEVSFDERPDGVEVWREVGEGDPTPFVQGAEERIYHSYEWAVMRPPWDVVEDILRDTLEELGFAPGSGEANALGSLVDIVFDQGHIGEDLVCIGEDECVHRDQGRVFGVVQLEPGQQLCVFGALGFQQGREGLDRFIAVLFRQLGPFLVGMAM